MRGALLKGRLPRLLSFLDTEAKPMPFRDVLLLTAALASMMMKRKSGNVSRYTNRKRLLMRVVRFYEYGGPEVLRLEDARVPEPGPGEALVKVAAAGVNYADTRRRLGMYVEPTPLPWAVGSEIAGTVVKLGGETGGVVPPRLSAGAGGVPPTFQSAGVGQRVMALIAGGGYADYALASTRALLPIPPS